MSAPRTGHCTLQETALARNTAIRRMSDSTAPGESGAIGTATENPLRPARTPPARQRWQRDCGCGPNKYTRQPPPSNRSRAPAAVIPTCQAIGRPAAS